MKVLFTASEALPFIKTGGLGEVVGALPSKLHELGMDVRVILPKYDNIPQYYRDTMEHICSFNVDVGWRKQYCGVEQIVYEGVTFYFIDNEYYFKRDRLYGYYDEAERFAFFCAAAIKSIKEIGFIPDIIHCHDWQTGMLCPMLHQHVKHGDKTLENIKTIFTIHNLGYQGIFPAEVLNDLMGLDNEYFNIEGVEFHNSVNCMKGGLNFAHIITTVSGTYAKEIQTAYYGENMEDILRKRADNLIGILNGIDYNLYDPSKDKNLFKSYNSRNPARKTVNKTNLQQMLNLPVDETVPLVSMVTRLTEQKGIDLVIHVMDELMQENLQMVVLGTGDYKYENTLREYAYKYPNKFIFLNAFDDVMARRIYASSDMFLMPSKFEPCGLSQLIALRYGTIPIVRETGGLKDTIIPYNEYNGSGNGFSFANYNAHEMLYVIKYALKIYCNDKATWCKMVKRAMLCDNSWSRSAELYKELYLKIAPLAAMDEGS